MASSLGRPLYRDPANGHIGRWWGSHGAHWLYCETCGLEGKHKRVAPDSWHQQYFRWMHRIAAARPYEGRHRAPEPKLRALVM